MKIKKFFSKLLGNFKLSLFYDIVVTVIGILKRYKNQISIAIISMFTLSFAISPIWYKVFNTSPKTPPIVNEKKFIQPICVTVIGEVQNPGMYELTDEDRINDAIEKAGGFTDKAYTDNINLAQRLVDEQYIKVPSVDEINYEDDYSGNINNEQSSFKEIININSATVSELCKLPGIGESTANKIIRYRELTGGFKSIDDIQNVEGIGPSKFKKIKNNITV